MARQPAPRIDPRDTALRPIKDFLEWLYRTVPGLDTSIADLSDTLTQFVAEAAALFAAQAAAIAAVVGDVAGLEALRGEMVMSFVHPPQPSGSAAARHMWPGYTASFDGGTNVMPWVIVPEDGELFSLVAKHIASTSADTDEITYTVLVCSGSNPTVYTTTTLTVTVEAASSVPVRDTAHTIAVNAGDMVNVRFTCSAAISNMPVAPNGGHWASLLYRRTS